ncbi:HAD-like protein [Clavulina sp. PMI_390]|nr:HAD-like protein [Clavulina sp. PMI_390]
MSSASFVVDAVLFDMDGTLVDSIAAVEAAWGKVAEDIGQDRDYVIAATHGKRAIDNLKQFKPHLKDHEMPDAVQEFEESILAFADEYHVTQKRRLSRSSSFASMSSAGGAFSASSSRAASMASSRRPSFASEMSSGSGNGLGRSMFGMTPMQPVETVTREEYERDLEEMWDAEEDLIDRSVQILPGVRRMIDSLPEGRYCVATSGAKTYAYGAMSRVGITPPKVTITADDPRLKNGKPFPDPFLLAAKCLGYAADRCVVFEDSPSGIRAGVASGAIVVALCTSHERAKIEHCGAHYLIENMDQIKCSQLDDGRLRFDIADFHSTGPTPHAASLTHPPTPISA